jgi:hypothetical protein
MFVLFARPFSPISTFSLLSASIPCLCILVSLLSLLSLSLRYVYWGLSTGQNAPVLLKWHAALVDKSGVGSIMRTLTERKVADNKSL